MIEIDNIFKTYHSPQGKFEALKGVSLSIRKGEIFGIIGPSGAGKSTLVQCINLLERPDSGSITIDGHNLIGLSEVKLRQQRRRIGIIFQGFNLLARRTVFENVALPLEIAGLAQKDIHTRVAHLLDLVGLAHLHDRYPAQISGGQKQRVGIARALANNPRVLLSDEATSALDPETTESILALLGEINRKTGITILMITHQMEVVRQICHRIAVINHGQIIELNQTARIFANPEQDITHAMVSSVTASEMTKQTLHSIRTKLQQAIESTGDIAQIWKLSIASQDTETLITDLTHAFNLRIALIQARIDNIQGLAVGTLFVSVQGLESQVIAAQSVLREKNISLREVLHESTTSQPALASVA